MKLKGILAVSGQSGLFKLISSMKNGLLVESLTDGRRLPVYGTQKVSSLEEISLYTESDDVKLSVVLDLLYEHEKGAASIDGRKTDDKTLREHFGKVLTNFDRKRVYSSDIRKLYNWYNQLQENGMLVKDEEEVKEETVLAEESKKDTKPKKKLADSEPAAVAKSKKTATKKSE